MMDLLVKPAVMAFLVTLSATPLMIRLATYLQIVDDPTRRPHPARLHERPVPRGGGIPLFLGIAVAALLFLPFQKLLLGILCGGLVVVTVGFLDDRKWTIHPYWRLGAQFLAAGVVVCAGVGIAHVSNPFGGVIDLASPQITIDVFGVRKTVWVLSTLLAVAWIVGLMNAVSWSSGVDGQLSGFTAVAALVAGVYVFRGGPDSMQMLVCVLAAATAGAYLGFLPWHVYPQKIMPGFGGATLAGFMLAVLSMLATAKVGMMLVVLAVPVADAGYAIIRRLLNGTNPIWGDALHLHHRLLRVGWSKRRVAYLYWLTTAVMGLISLNVDTQGLLVSGVVATLAVGAVLIKLSGLTLPPRSSVPEVTAPSPRADVKVRDLRSGLVSRSTRGREANSSSKKGGDGNVPELPSPRAGAGG